MRLFRRRKPSVAPNAAAAPVSTPSGVVSASQSVDSQFLELFDSKWYLEVNGDVATAGLDPLTHFIAYGEAEGRDPNPTFSIRFYRETFMQNEPAGTSPVLHYLKRGRDLGYDPGPGNLMNYRRLVAAQEQSYGLELPELRRHIALMTAKPLFVVWLGSDDRDSIARIRIMLETQIYERWVLCTGLDEILGVVEQQSPEDWRLVWLDGSETLHSSALYCYASKINESPSADLIYADEDELDADGRRSRPFFKPDWSPDYFESFNYVGTGACLSGYVCASIFGEATDSFDLMLLATETARKVEHIRQILVHRTSGLDTAKPREQLAREIDALHRRLRRTGRTGIVTPVRCDRACYDIRLTMRSTPLVSIVIPTAGKVARIRGRQIDLIFNCLDKLAANTSYENIEIIVVHNGDLGRARLENLVKLRVKTQPYWGDVNVARKLNFGAAQGRGDYLLLMNDDIEPIAQDWIERMLEHFEKPHVGVVGAKLLFPTMKIQHAGVVLINAKPDHVRFKFPHDDEGYYYSTCAVRNFSAVTGAVMMTRASLFKQLGGYTEALPMNFNDVDYCLKAKRAGYTTVYAPQAELIHYESTSRVREVDSREVEIFEKEWADFTTDPYYNEAMLKNRLPDYEIVPSQRPIG
jgi:glycosyltransferase involved in cell wall biosynthesis